MKELIYEQQDASHTRKPNCRYSQNGYQSNKADREASEVARKLDKLVIKAFRSTVR